eukprot:5821-Chlamydomonas_euryale.AAC.2
MCGHHLICIAYVERQQANRLEGRRGCKFFLWWKGRGQCMGLGRLYDKDWALALWLGMGLGVPQTVPGSLQPGPVIHRIQDPPGSCRSPGIRPSHTRRASRGRRRAACRPL